MLILVDIIIDTKYLLKCHESNKYVDHPCTRIMCKFGFDYFFPASKSNTDLLAEFYFNFRTKYADRMLCSKSALLNVCHFKYTFLKYLNLHNLCNLLQILILALVDQGHYYE